MVSPGFITFSVISLVKGLSSLIRPPFSEVTVIEATSPLTSRNQKSSHRPQIPERNIFPRSRQSRKYLDGSRMALK